MNLLIAAAVFALASGNATDSSSGAGAASTPAWIHETSWEFEFDGRPMQESVDGRGNYIINSGSQHIDHGMVAVKDGKACMTSAMNSEGEICWSDPKLEIGASGETVSDKGGKLVVKRVPYVARTI